MSTIVAEGRRFLPRGYADLALQLAIWFGWAGAYQVARGLADGDRAPEAFSNAIWVVELEQRVGDLWERSLQSILISSDFLIEAASFTYWLSQFAVLGLALLFVYVRHNRFFTRFRNVVLLANFVGLLGYVALPTAPPRMLPSLGFIDTLALFSSINHQSAGVQLASNPYAAMPSLHAADALLVGVVLAVVVRRLWAKLLWLAWPVWVWFCVMATANHFWLDIAAGIAVAGLAAAVVYARPLVARLR